MNALVSGRSYGKNLSNNAAFNQYTKTCQAYNVLNVGVFFRESCWCWSSEVLEEDERTKEAF